MLLLRSLFESAASIGTVVLQFVILLLIAVILFSKHIELLKKVRTWITDRAYGISLFICSAGTLISLIYYYAFRYPLCDLSWYQHVCLYSLFVIFLLAVWWREQVVSKYALVLASLGFLFALLHFSVQQVDPASVTNSMLRVCTEVTIKYFGYLTIPVMSMTGFATLVLILCLVRNKK